MSALQDRFAEHFRRHLLPRLQVRLPDAALAVLHEQKSYGAVFYELRWFAWFRGGSFLPGDLFHDLEWWLHQRLTEEIDRLEPLVEEMYARPRPEPPPDDVEVWAQYAALCSEKELVDAG
jgi:hypothetical protein